MSRSLLRLPIIAAALSAAVLLVACETVDLDTVEPETGVTTVSVEDNRFAPAVIEVPAGTEVTWDWTGNAAHDVDGDGWSSDVQRSGTFAFQFDEPGTYDYTCTLHRGMDGRIIVTGGDER